MLLFFRISPNEICWDLVSGRSPSAAAALNSGPLTRYGAQFPPRQETEQGSLNTADKALKDFLLNSNGGIATYE
jgi:hypothetical protein